MDFEQKKIINNNQKNYHIENLKITREFSKKLLKETDELVRSIVIFGSNNNNTLKKNSDIDIMVVLDNVSVFVSDELREAYRIITSKLINETSDKIHLMSVNLTDLWDMARKGDPIFINILRHGVAIFDRDLIEPMQYLLEIGKIRPTKEAINNYMARSETLFDEVDKKIQEGIFDLYYSLSDMIHSTLMIHKITPPSPKDMPKIFEDEFKDNKKISSFSKDFENLYKLVKEIEYGTKSKIKGVEFDKIKSKVENIIKTLKKYNNDKMLKMDSFDL